MYAFEVEIENQFNNASCTRALPKLYFDSLKMIHCDLGISVLWQHVHRQLFVNVVLWVIYCAGKSYVILLSLSVLLLYTMS